jgi:ABC-type proline/glycine betaine transport system permease subunit
LANNHNQQHMQKSKKSISIFMIVGALLALRSYLPIWDDKMSTARLVMVICALVFLGCGILSLVNSIRKERKG